MLTASACGIGDCRLSDPRRYIVQGLFGGEEVS